MAGTAGAAGGCHADTVRRPYGEAMTDRGWSRAITVLLGGAGAVVGTFLPWFRSGAIDRSSYELFDIVERLGFAPDGMMGWLLRLWPLVPLLFVIGIVLQFLSDDYPGIVVVRWIVPFAAATYAGGVAIGLQFAPEAALFSSRYGAAITATGSAVVVTALLGPALSRVFRPEKPVTRATGRGRSARP